MAQTNPKVLLILAEGAEEMEVTITVDVLRRAGVEVVVAGLSGDEPVACSRGLRLVPDLSLAAAVGPFDAVVLPGGLGGTEQLCAAAEVGALLREQWTSGRMVAAICAAPMALAAHRVGAGLPMACHPSVDEAVRAHAEWVDAPVVVTSQLITSQGPGTAFEFALALVARLASQDVADGLRGPMMLPAVS